MCIYLEEGRSDFVLIFCRARERTCDLQRQLETEAIDQPRGGRKTGVMADTELREREGETETNEEGLAKLQEEV